MMNRYLDEARLNDDRSACFQPSKTKYDSRPRAKGLSYTRPRELVLESFQGIVPDVSKIGTHSLRSGRAFADANAGVTDRLLKRLAWSWALQQRQRWLRQRFY